MEILSQCGSEELNVLVVLSGCYSEMCQRCSGRRGVGRLLFLEVEIVLQCLHEHTQTGVAIAQCASDA